MNQSGRCAFGPVRQLGYVVDDVQSVAQHWIERFGAGPFFLIEGLSFPQWFWLGEPQVLKLDIMIGQYGNAMVELVKPLFSGPSAYAHCMGQGQAVQLHHYGFLVPNLDEAAGRLSVGPAMSGGATNAGSRFGYFDTRPTIGVLTELIEETDETRALMALTRDSALDWDGRDPVRRISL